LNNIKIVGLGGIGSVLIESISRFLNYSIQSQDPIYITLIDGDVFESKNYERQIFHMLGNKAEVKTKELQMKFDRVNFKAINSFVNSENISSIISNGDILFLCVDNHKTRKCVSDFCKTLENVTLISGGNEITDGNVQVFIRREGKDLTSSLTDYHPEIENPTDKSPDEMSCEELSKSAPQLFFTNLTVATIMCWTFFNFVANNKVTTYSEIYFDIKTMSTLPKFRKVKQKAA